MAFGGKENIAAAAAARRRSIGAALSHGRGRLARMAKCGTGMVMAWSSSGAAIKHRVKRGKCADTIFEACLKVASNMGRRGSRARRTALKAAERAYLLEYQNHRA